MRSSKPAFHSVVDLGLRDVGVDNQPRRLAAHFGKSFVPLVALVVICAFATCALVSQLGAGRWIIFAIVVGWMAGLVALGVRIVNRAPVVVVKVTADGSNQATWLVIASSVLGAVCVVVMGGPLLIPLVALVIVTIVFTWLGRGRLPELLQELRSQLAADESVSGDGIGVARGARGRDAFRLVVATDRRVVVAAPRRPPVVDAPYRRVSGFAIEWKYRGRVGVLSLTVDDELHIITSIAPANLVSIARALQANGVPADDPEAVTEAERAWEEALLRGEAPKPLFDRDATSSREFDRGLWLLLGLAVLLFYVDPFGIGRGVSSGGAAVGLFLLVVAVVCLISGYVSGTRSSLGYIAPLALLLAPGLFLVDPSGMLALLLVTRLVAGIGLWVGSALRRRATPGAASAVREAPPLSSARLVVRISGVLLVSVVATASIATAAGFDLSTLRLALEEASAEKLPADGRSNLTGRAASLTYTPGPDLKELIRDEHWGAGPNDGARWELRTSWREGHNVITLAHYIFEPSLDDPAAIADFIAGKDGEHSRIAGSDVAHTERVVDGRKGYVWNHENRHGAWVFAAWFPQPVHSVRVECTATTQQDRFKRLCDEAMASLKFH